MDDLPLDPMDPPDPAALASELEPSSQTAHDQLGHDDGMGPDDDGMDDSLDAWFVPTAQPAPPRRWLLALSMLGVGVALGSAATLGLGLVPPLAVSGLGAAVPGPPSAEVAPQLELEPGVVLPAIGEPRVPAARHARAEREAPATKTRKRATVARSQPAPPQTEEPGVAEPSRSAAPPASTLRPRPPSATLRALPATGDPVGADGDSEPLDGALPQG